MDMNKNNMQLLSNVSKKVDNLNKITNNLAILERSI